MQPGLIHVSCSSTFSVQVSVIKINIIFITILRKSLIKSWVRAQTEFLLYKQVSFNLTFLTYKMGLRDFPRGPLVKNLPCNTGDMGSIPGQGTRVPHAVEQLSPSTTTRESKCCNERSCMWQLRPEAAK